MLPGIARCRLAHTMTPTPSQHGRATWGVHVPTVKLHYALGEQALAIAMLAAGIGAVGTLTQAGRIVGRHGPRRAAIVSGVLCVVSVAALLVSSHYAVLLALMVVFGIGTSLFDVSINAAASDLERLGQRSLMSGFHGMFRSWRQVQ